MTSVLRITLLVMIGTSLPAANVDFSHQVVPILKQHCTECHAGDKKKGGFSMNDRATLLKGSENGAMIEVGKGDKSHFIEVLLSKDPDEQMPPKGKRLTSDEVALLRAWIDGGLPWEDGFAFKKPAYEPPLKPRQVSLPPSIEGRSNPVDRIIDAYLTKNKLPRPEPLEDAAFMRRAHLDIIGLPPSAEALDKFMADKSSDKRAKLVAALLGDDISYADHWLTFWNDLLRNDYGGTGFVTGGRKQVSKWLYQSLVENKPFDQFTRELIAPTDESRGYIDGIKWRGDVSAGQTVEIQFAQSVGQTFLGINLKCASCHDSFIDRWKLDEAYGLAAIYSNRELEISRCDKPVGRKATASWLFPEIGQVDPKATQSERLQQLAALMTHPQNGRVTRTIVNRLWHRFMGRGIVHPVDSMQTEPWSSDLLDYLASDLAANHYDLKKTMALIATSQAYQSKTQVVAKSTDDHGYTYAGPRAKRLTAEQFVDAVWQLTGAAPSKFDAPVLRGKADPVAAKNIKPAAQWIWGDSAKDGKLPPAGEKIVLRKQFKLGKDIERATAVVTCDNSFVLYVNNRQASQGDNWAQLMALPLKGLVREGSNTITVVATNGGKGPNAAGLYFDARIHLGDGSEVTIATDSTWTWSDQIPGFKEGHLVENASLAWKPVTEVKALPVWSKAIDSKVPVLLASGSANDSRMIRASLLKSDFLMRTLGRPNRDQIVSMRPNDLTTLEAIDLANGQVFADALAKGAKTLAARSWDSPENFVKYLFKSALTRDPSPEELSSLAAAVGTKPSEQSIQDALWAVCMMPEFQFIR